MNAMPKLPARKPVQAFTSTSERNSLDVVLCFALVMRFHGPDANQLRRTARSLADRAYYEHRPKLKRLAKMEGDTKVLDCVWQMIDRTWELSGISQELPMCHMKPMRAAGHMLYCQHCTHTKIRRM